ncbi:MAG: hypothetical protein N2254_06055 [bacterium]|nr:hypothetical protein [bacterium]
MLVCGIDENGLGPFLGPLIITAYEREEKNTDPTEYSKIKDSKEIFSRKPNDFEIIEEFFLKELGKTQNLYEIFRRSIFRNWIEKVCPISPKTLCFSDVKIPQWINHSENLKDSITDKANKNIRFAIICPHILKIKVQELGSKFSANAYFVCYMALKSNSEKVICGKSGFKKNYEYEMIKAMQDIGIKADLKKIQESNEISSYIVQSEDTTKQIHFVKDADSKFQEVSFASIIGKYIRELCMLSITKFLDPKRKFPISGYGKKNEMKNTVYEILKKIQSNHTVEDINKIRDFCIERNY